MAENDIISFELSLKSSEAGDFLSQLRRRFPKLIVQLLTLDEAARNAKLFELIGAQTIKSVGKKSLLANKPEVDLLLRLAGTTQIGTALKRVGYGKGGKNKVLVAIGERGALARLRRYCMEKHGLRMRLLDESPLTSRELERVEQAALLSARRFSKNSA